MSEVGIEEKVKEMFRWIEDVPVAISLSDAETLHVIQCNQLFSAMFHLPATGGIQMKLDGVNPDDGAKSVLSLHAGGMMTRVLTSVKRFKIDGKDILLSAHENLMDLIKTDDETGMHTTMKKSELKENAHVLLVDNDKEYAIGGVFSRKGGLDTIAKHMNLAKEGVKFTLVYFRIESFGEGVFNEAESLDAALSAVKGGTRQTDILAKMDANDYVLIFPKCAYEVVESIMGTIEKKFEMFNETTEVGYTIAIEYTIAEYDPAKKQTPEAFVEDLKQDLD